MKFEIIIIIILAIFIIKKSKFGNTNKSIDDSKIGNITKDTVLIFHAPWCGHCKTSMPEFKKAVIQGKGNVVLIDSDEKPELVKKYNIRGFPTIIKEDGEKFTGKRTSDDILSFANM